MFDPVRDPTVLLVIAYAMRRLPFVLRSAEAGLLQLSRSVEDAAQSLGAPPRRILLRITLPLVLPLAILVGVLIRMVSDGPVLFRQRE